MTFQESIKSCIQKNYANFNGRATRSEYWWFLLFQCIIIIVAASISAALYGLVVLGLILPSLAVSVRRLHDVNKSGWFYLFILIPLIGPILLFVWFCSDSVDKGNNF
jgi:uncharacterized membrane protein YhaH (DUF805 family)